MPGIGLELSDRAYVSCIESSAFDPGTQDIVDLEISFLELYLLCIPSLELFQYTCFRDMNMFH